MEHLRGILVELCRNVDKLLMLFVAEALALLLLVPSLFYVERGTATYVVLLLDLVGLVGLMSFTGVILVKCYRI
ncbi:hypothetical protein [Halosimplex marinum]|uniref:hypothetical protein n=1 Tax=Halosimplex marinum TaxID=3396620 RepID=UPI003F544BCB